MKKMLLMVFVVLAVLVGCQDPNEPESYESSPDSRFTGFWVYQESFEPYGWIYQTLTFDNTNVFTLYQESDFGYGEQVNQLTATWKVEGAAFYIDVGEGYGWMQFTS